MAVVQADAIENSHSSHLGGMQLFVVAIKHTGKLDFQMGKRLLRYRLIYVWHINVVVWFKGWIPWFQSIQRDSHTKDF